MSGSDPLQSRLRRAPASARAGGERTAPLESCDRCASPRFSGLRALFLLRILPSEDRGGRPGAVRDDCGDPAAEPRLRVGDLRSRWLQPRRGRRSDDAHQAGLRDRGDGAPERRRRDRRGLETILKRFADAGIENVLALRGDPPAGEGTFKPTPGGLTSSAELAAFIRPNPLTADFGSARPASPSPPRGRIRRGRHRLPQGEGGRGCRVPDLPALLRQRRLLRLARRGPRRRHRRPGDPGDPADHLARRPPRFCSVCDAAPRVPRRTARGPRAATRKPSVPSGSPTRPASARSSSPPAFPGSTSSC